MLTLKETELFLSIVNGSPIFWEDGDGLSAIKRGLYFRPKTYEVNQSGEIIIKSDSGGIAHVMNGFEMMEEGVWMFCYPEMCPRCGKPHLGMSSGVGGQDYCRKCALPYEYQNGFDQSLVTRADLHKYGQISMLSKVNMKCECGKDTHGFANHADWCPKYNGKIHF